jgi:predicted enzyme related to lactoylglutathione lyase
MKITEVAFAAIAVTDIARSRNFYENVLGLKVGTEGMGGNWVEYEIGPHTVAIGCHPDWKPSKDGTSTAFEVDDFSNAVEKLKANCVEFSMGPLETPVCHMGIFHDPDGNTLLIHKRKIL